LNNSEFARDELAQGVLLRAFKRREGGVVGRYPLEIRKISRLFACRA
jgi:hypothetical protein